MPSSCTTLPPRARREGHASVVAVVVVAFPAPRNEVAFSLYALTQNPDHLALANLFYKKVFMDPLASNQDSLNNNHANTHLPEVVGVARGWEVTANKTLKAITGNFFGILSSKYSYSTGGSNVNEHWSSPNRLGDAIATR